MDYKEKLAQAGKLFADARAILEKADATAEEKTNAVKMVTDAKALKAEAAQLKELEQAALDLAVETKDTKSAPAPASGFKNLGQFLYAVARAGNVLTLREAVHPALMPLAAKASCNSTAPAMIPPTARRCAMIRSRI